MSTSFTDNFSKQSAAYQKYRPTYPTKLFSFLSSLTTEHELAWDCGTGNGQSAIGLADFYKSVYATDPSEQQIKYAMPNPQIVYKVEQAEICGLPDHSADLITIAQALHWFDFDKFYREVKRVLKPDGIIAAWTYGLPLISPEIDKVIRHFHDHVVGEFWQAENRLVEKEYTTIPFPFKSIPAPDFTMKKDLTLLDLLGLITSWSAVQKFKDQKGLDPVAGLKAELSERWRNPENQKTVTWNIILKVGQNTGSDKIK
jgi:SAM-dependent methyltransferase